MSSAVVEEPPAKKPKVDNVDKDIDYGGPLLSFHEFSMDRVLFTDPSTKAMAVCGRFSGSEDTAVIVAEKQPLEHSTIRQLFEKRDGGVVRNTHNDIYSQYVVQCRGDVGTLKLTTVYPATDKHVRKYSRQMFHLVHETPQIYKDVTKPFIEQQGFSIKVEKAKKVVFLCKYNVNMCSICVFQWVDNILNGISESDRVVYDDPDPETGFLLLPDLKWDMKNMDTLYMLALARKREILSLRELTSEHLPLLKNILEKGKVGRHFCYFWYYSVYG